MACFAWAYVTLCSLPVRIDGPGAVTVGAVVTAAFLPLHPASRTAASNDKQAANFTARMMARRREGRGRVREGTLPRLGGIRRRT